MECEMNQTPVYSAYQPRWYRPRVSTYWWLGQWGYLKFILRELSSIFVAYFVVLILLQLCALRNGPEAYAAFQSWLRMPGIVALNVVSLAFVLFHTITWFNLAPRALVVRLGGTRLPDPLIAGSNYVAWLVVSVAVAWLILRG
jgi:succinate dehydrogenase subunit C